MKSCRQWGIRLIIWSVCLLAAGCTEAARQGITSGLANGIAGVIESLIASSVPVDSPGD